jgi:hypothetical protein
MSASADNSVTINVWLDDERPAPEGWLHFKTARLCIAALDMLRHSSKIIESISLDHDLGPPDAGTGYDVICWIEKMLATDESYVPPKNIDVHTQNASARVKMLGAVNSIVRIKASKENVEFSQ